ncbi:MAG: Cof-type HAD-IIB family hydrolase [Lachnospiraceae bacterium]|nr:Cof-type HAD-IIB family hydrolase [Lachnospiraceae bacterium]
MGSDKQISRNVTDAVIDAQQRGKKVAIATGRSIAGIRKIASKIMLEKFGGYVIAYNGTTVINCKTGECVYNKTIPSDIIKPVYEAAKKENVCITVYNDKDKEMICGNGINEYTEMDSKACDISIREEKDFVKAVNFPVNKILLSGDPERMKEIENIMERQFGDRLNIFRSDPCYVELLPKFVDKGTAVEKLAKHLDIAKNKVICVGDSYNDLPMLRFAGMGIAMGNAQSEVKEAADFVTLSNDEDGVACVIKKFMTPKPEETEKIEDKENSEETHKAEEIDKVIEMENAEEIAETDNN